MSGIFVIQTWQEAKDSPETLNGLVRRGWVWRRHSGTVRWTFTTSLTTRGLGERTGYPATAEFITVYAKTHSKAT